MMFNGWFGLLRVILVGVPAYATLVVILRISGKRTLSKMNAFDLIVTVSLGSTLATVVLSRDVALAEGATAFALLIGLQFAVAWLASRSRRIERLVKAEPALLCFEGRFLAEALRRERVTEAELRAAARSQGLGSMEDVGAIVMETNGDLTVLRRHGGAEYSALGQVARPDR